jgi:heavy metal translocating P-type ATPase
MSQPISAQWMSSDDDPLVSTCAHCGLAAPKPLFSNSDVDKTKPFCCYGCMSVFTLLKSKGLDEFYTLKEQGEFFAPQEPAKPIEGQYLYLDEAEFLKDHASEYSDELVQMRFYLEGINCVACLWLVEKVPDFVAGMVSAKLDLSSSVVTLTRRPSGKFSEAVKLIAAMGFRPTPLKNDQDHLDLAAQEDRKDMIRIGIAAAASMNIMLYTISLYAGAPDSYSQLFGLIIFIFALPVIFYSAIPFYKSAWAAARMKKISLDTPIAFALIYGTIRGVIEISQGKTEYYFDTLTVLVFLLSLSRFVVKKWGRRGLATDALSPLLGQDPIRVLEDNGQWVEKHPDYLKKGDLIAVQSGQMVPADGQLESEQGHFQTALLTGESIPHPKALGDSVLAGYLNSGQEIRMRVSASGKESVLGRMLVELQAKAKDRSHYSNMADRVAQRLVPIIFGLSLLIIVGFWLFTGDLLEGERRALSLIIITCPCALGLATPLALARSLNLAHRRGIVMKDETLLERIHLPREIILDKTGTLTLGEFRLIDEVLYKYDSERIYALVLALERYSDHPLARAFKEAWRGEQHNNQLNNEVENRLELIGRGVQARIQGKEYFLGASTQSKNHEAGITTLDLIEDGELIARFTLGDQLRAEAPEIIRKWQKRGLKLWILSGDKRQHVKALGEKLGLAHENLKGELLPEEKAQIVEGLPNSLMIGDGANDAPALKRASIGIAVKGSMELALKSSDLYLTRTGLRAIDELFDLSRATVQLIRRNLHFSLSYNIASTILAVMGLVNPLVAAIIMPLSSLTVVASTVWGNSSLRALGRRN